MKTRASRTRRRTRSSSFFNKNKIKSPFFNAPTIQAKLSIGKTDDKYERQADRMSEKVVPNVQRKCAACGEKEPIQMKASTSENATAHHANLESRLQQSRGGGAPLAKGIRMKMENGFGASFKKVRIHTNQRAVQMNQELGADAFTHGSDIYFNEGKFSVQSTSGKKLLAHELTHVVQQGAAGPSIQMQSRPITSRRIQELRQLARNPQNFAGGRNAWRRLSLAEKGAVQLGMDGYYGRAFTTAFVGFANRRQLSGGGICLSHGGPIGESCFDRRIRSLWRRPRFPVQFPRCQTLIYPDGTEFARCAPRQTPSQSMRSQLRRIIAEARRLRAAGNTSGATQALERGRSMVEQLELDTARRFGLRPNVTDPDAVIDFIVRRQMMMTVPLPPEVNEWRRLVFELEGGSLDLSDDELFDELTGDDGFDDD